MQLEQYKARLKEYTSRMLTLREMRETNPSINAIFTTLDTLTKKGVDRMGIDELLGYGSEVVGHSAYIKSQAAYFEGVSKVAEIAYSEVYDNTFLMFKDAETTATEARSQARAFTREAELDSALQTQLAKEWKVAAEAAQDLLIFIEVALKHSQQEKYNSSQA